MLIFSKCLYGYICHIVVCVYIGVVDYLASIQLSTVVIGNIDVFSSSVDDSSGDKSESTLTVPVDWQRW